MEGTFVVVLLLVAAVCVVLGTLANRKRRQELQAEAERLGLRFQEEDPVGIPERYRALDALAQGRDRKASNVMRGQYRGHEVLVFDYRFVTGSGKDEQTHYLSGWILRLPRAFPELRVRPEGFLDGVGAMLGFDDIDFESIEFSRAYHVKAKDRKFAYDFFHTRTMEYFLMVRGITLEIEGDALLLVEEGTLKPERVEPPLVRAAEIRSLFPGYLFRS